MPLHFDYDSMAGANEVFKDRETGSRWQQASAAAISGPLEGAHLALYPFIRTIWSEWRRRHPDTLVLKPVPGYAELMPAMNKLIDQTRLGAGPAPRGLRPRETVAGLEIRDEAKAYSVAALREVRVINDQLGGTPVLIVHQPGSDTTTAFDARRKGRRLRFRPANEEASQLVDLETKSAWNAYGLCVSGPLKGWQLKPLILVPEFWFAWSEFHPKTTVYSNRGVQ